MIVGYFELILVEMYGNIEKVHIIVIIMLRLISTYNAVKCNLTELTTRSTSLAFAVSGLLDMRMCQDSSGAWSIGRCSSFVGVLAFSER